MNHIKKIVIILGLGCNLATIPNGFKNLNQIKRLMQRPISISNHSLWSKITAQTATSKSQEIKAIPVQIIPDHKMPPAYTHQKELTHTKMKYKFWNALFYTSFAAPIITETLSVTGDSGWPMPCFLFGLYAYNKASKTSAQLSDLQKKYAIEDLD